METIKINELINEFILSDMLVKYIKDEMGHVGFEAIPVNQKSKINRDKTYEIDPLVQVYKRGDLFPGGFSNGHTMRNGESTVKLLYDKQTVEKNENLETITRTPSAYITVAVGSVNDASQRLLTIHRNNIAKMDQAQKLPIVFNEFCTTWGIPSHFWRHTAV